MKTQTQNNALTTEAISKITDKLRKENETSLDAKVQAQLPKIQNIPGVQVYRQSTQQNLYWSLCWAVKVSCTVKNSPFWEHQEVYITVGSLDDGVLVELVDETDKKRDDYTASEIRRLQEVYRVKMKEARQAERALYPFRYND